MKDAIIAAKKVCYSFHLFFLSLDQILFTQWHKEMAKTWFFESSTETRQRDLAKMLTRMSWVVDGDGVEKKNE